MVVGDTWCWMSSMVAAEFGVGRADGIDVGGGTMVVSWWCIVACWMWCRWLDEGVIGVVASLDGAMCWKSRSVNGRGKYNNNKNHKVNKKKRITRKISEYLSYPYSDVAAKALDPTGLVLEPEQTFSPLAALRNPYPARKHVRWLSLYLPRSLSTSKCHYHFLRRTPLT